MARCWRWSTDEVTNERLNLRKEFHLDRSGQISKVLARHGLDYLAGTLGLERFAATRRLFGHAPHETPLTQLSTCAWPLEEMGTTFIELGQILSTRTDLLPSEYLAELTKLQDSAAPAESTVVQQTLVAELGQPIESVFASFDLEPSASASIGQAHDATLPDVLPGPPCFR